MKVVIFGAGRMARRFIQSARNNKLEVVGICDLLPEALAAAQREFGLKEDQLFADATKMIACCGAELAIVATTANVHYEYAMLAIEHGCRYLLVEKPMATSLKKCDLLIDASKKNGTILGLNHQMRHITEYNRVKILLDSVDDELNTIVVQAGNAGLAMNGLHFFEAFQYLAGSEIVDVVGWIRPEFEPNPRGEQFLDPGGAIRVQTENGKSMYIDLDTRNGHGMQMMVAGRNAQICLDMLEGKLTMSSRKPENRNRVTGHYSTESDILSEDYLPMNAVASSTIVLSELLKGHEGNFVTGDEGRRLVAVLVAANISSENNHKTIKIRNDLLPLDRDFSWA